MSITSCDSKELTANNILKQNGIYYRKSAAFTPPFKDYLISTQDFQCSEGNVNFMRTVSVQ